MSKQPDLQEMRADLEGKLRKLADKVAGTGHPKAPGVSVEVRPAVEYGELEGGHPITKTYDTVATVTVNDEDATKAETVADRIVEVLETDWVEHDLRQAPKLSKSKPHAVEARFWLDPPVSEPAE